MTYVAVCTWLVCVQSPEWPDVGQDGPQVAIEATYTPVVERPFTMNDPVNAWRCEPLPLE